MNAASVSPNRKVCFRTQFNNESDLHRVLNPVTPIRGTNFCCGEAVKGKSAHIQTNDQEGLNTLHREVGQQGPFLLRWDFEGRGNDDLVQCIPIAGRRSIAAKLDQSPSLHEEMSFVSKSSGRAR